MTRFGIDKTPVFDSAAGGFVYVYGGTHLKKRRSAILSPIEEELKPRISRIPRMRKWDELFPSVLQSIKIFARCANLRLG